MADNFAGALASSTRHLQRLDPSMEEEAATTLAHALIDIGEECDAYLAKYSLPSKPRLPRMNLTRLYPTYSKGFGISLTTWVTLRL